MVYHAHLLPKSVMVTLMGEDDEPFHASIISGEKDVIQPDREVGTTKAYWLPNEGFDWVVFWGPDPLTLDMMKQGAKNRSLFVVGKGFSVAFAIPPDCSFSGPPTGEPATAWDRILKGEL